MTLVLTCFLIAPSHLLAPLCAQELVPIQYVGKIVLNRLPTDFFAEVRVAVAPHEYAVAGCALCEASDIKLQTSENNQIGVDSLTAAFA
jgi:hypothetical protein